MVPLYFQVRPFDKKPSMMFNLGTSDSAVLLAPCEALPRPEGVKHAERTAAARLSGGDLNLPKKDGAPPVMFVGL